MNRYDTESLAKSFLVYIHHKIFYINLNHNNRSKLTNGLRGPNLPLSPFASRIFPYNWRSSVSVAQYVIFVIAKLQSAALTRSQFPSDCSLSNLTGQPWNIKHACHSASRHWMESQPGHFHKLWNRQNWNIPGVGLDAQVPIIGHKHNIPLNGDWLVRWTKKNQNKTK